MRSCGRRIRLGGVPTRFRHRRKATIAPSATTTASSFFIRYPPRSLCADGQLLNAPAFACDVVRDPCRLVVGRAFARARTCPRTLPECDLPRSCRRDKPVQEAVSDRDLRLLRAFSAASSSIGRDLACEQLLGLHRLPAPRAAVVADQEELVEPELVPELDQLLADPLGRAGVDDLVARAAARRRGCGCSGSPRRRRTRSRRPISRCFSSGEVRGSESIGDTLKLDEVHRAARGPPRSPWRRPRPGRPPSSSRSSTSSRPRRRRRGTAAIGVGEHDVRRRAAEADAPAVG